MFGLRHYAPLPVPAAFLPFLGLVGELGKHPRRFACLTPLPGRLPHLRPDDPPQPLVACQPEHVVDSVAFTPTHQLIAAEAGVAPQNDLHLRPRRADLRHDALELRQTAGRGVAVGLPQSRTQNLISAEDVQRQVAVAVIVAVEEAPFLLSVQGEVGGVHIQDDFLRSGGVRFHEHLDQQLINAGFPERDLLVTARCAVAEFQPIQGALARQRTVLHICFARQHPQQRVVP